MLLFMYELPEKLALDGYQVLIPGVISAEFPTCHCYASFILQDLRSSVMPSACLRMFVLAKPNSSKVDYCVSVTM